MLTTGYVESTTAGKGVIRVVTDQAFTYVGTGSTLVGQATATNATTLNLFAPSITLNSGTLTALGDSSLALSVTANGGAGSGGINATVNGDILSAAGPAVVLNSTAVAGTQNVVLTSTAGNDITSGAGSAVTISTAGSGGINVNLAGAVTATGGIGVLINNTASSAGVSVTTGAVTASDTGINVQSQSTAGGVTIVTNGAVAGGIGFGVLATTVGSGLVHVTNNGGVASGAAGGPGISADNFGSGSILVDGNGAITGGTDANGNLAASATGGGNITITGNGVISGGGTNGIFAEATGGNGNVNITRGGTVSGGTGINASALGTGTVGVTTTGAGSTITSTTGDGVQTTAVDGLTTINLAGAVNAAGGAGIDASATGTGGLNITTAAITATDSKGVLTSTTTGSQLITLGGAVTAGGQAVRADATTGAITVNINANANNTDGGDVIATDNDGVSIVNVQAGRTVNGVGDVINFYGNGANATLNNSGTIGSATSNDAVFTDITKGVTVNNLVGGVMNGKYDLSDLADTINNRGTLNIRSLSSFLGGVDAVNNLAGGIVNFANGSEFSGLESIANTGTINVAGTLAAGGSTLSGAGTLNLAAASAVTGLGATTLGATNAGAGSSLAGTGAFINGGRLDTAGAFTVAGFTTMINPGTIDLAPGAFAVPAVAFANSGTIIADEGASSITGQTAFNNSGAIRLNDGATGDVLTINSPFVGSGASNLNIDVSSTAADKLVIIGAASGSTVINVQPVGGVVVNSTGILVVDPGTSTATAFRLGSTIGTSLIDFSLRRVGEDFFLFAAPNANAFNPLALINIGTDMWYQSADIYDNYAALKRSDLTAGAQPLGIWGQVYLSDDRYGDTDTQNVFGTDVAINEHLKTERRGIQGGADYNFGAGVVGITGGWQKAKAKLGGVGAEVKGTGWNAGGYAIFGSATGFYGGLLAKYDKNKVRIDSPAFVGLGKLDSTSWGAEGEAGYRLPVGSSTVDLGGGLAWVTTKHDDFSFGGIGYDFAKSKSLRGRLGIRFESAFGAFVDGKVFHEFRKHNDLTLSSGTEIDTIEAEGKGTWFRGEIGYGKPASSGPIAAVWWDVGDVKGIGAKLGFRFGGARAAEPLPPPPPPPPPPATQTCPDGSVILATDACPVPPPPPPPPPPAPERGL